MGFYRVREINGNSYVYFEERWREGRKVRSRSTFIRKLGDLIEANLVDPLPSGQAQADKWAEWQEKKEAALRESGKQTTQAVGAAQSQPTAEATEAAALPEPDQEGE